MEIFLERPPIVCHFKIYLEFSKVLVKKKTSNPELPTVNLATTRGIAQIMYKGILFPQPISYKKNYTKLIQATTIPFQT